MNRRPTRPPPDPPPRALSQRSSFRADIEGLRAIAVLSVMLWHAQIPGARGGFVGVDAFFVISGYLMTLILTRELAERGRISLTGFYARRAKRLLPAACVVIVATVVGARLILTGDRWADTSWDGVWSALYSANWRMIHQHTDYLAADRPPSPFQHFWSLSVEEQFYAVFPVLLIAAMWGWRRWVRPAGGDGALPVAAKGGALVVLSAVFVGSLAWCLTQTVGHPQSAYFSTFTRVWELALGGLVAVGGHVIRGRVLRAWLSVGGLSVLVATIALLHESSPFPGWRALLPTVATAAIIGAGMQGTSLAGRVLAWRPLVWIGALSYSLYLWHWPVLVLGRRLVGRANSGHLTDLGLLVVTLVLSWLSYRFVENPVRQWRPRAAHPARAHLRLGLTLTAVAALSGLALSAEVRARNAGADAALRDVPGARILPDPLTTSNVPSLAALRPKAVQDPVTFSSAALPDYWRHNCYADVIDTRVPSCEDGDPRTTRRVFLVGDSHAGMWEPAVVEAGRTLGFRVTTLIKHDCPLADAFFYRPFAGPNVSCRRWYPMAMARLLAAHPDAVITGYSSPRFTRSAAGKLNTMAISQREMAAGLARTWNQLIDAGIPVYVISPIGHMGGAVTCAMEHDGDSTHCGVARTTFMRGPNRTYPAAMALAPRARPLDLAAVVCPLRTCPAVIGGLYVFRDPTHLTKQYARSASGHLVSLLMQQGFPATPGAGG